MCLKDVIGHPSASVTSQDGKHTFRVYILKRVECDKITGRFSGQILTTQDTINLRPDRPGYLFGKLTGKKKRSILDHFSSRSALRVLLM